MVNKNMSSQSFKPPSSPSCPLISWAEVLGGCWAEHHRTGWTLLHQATYSSLRMASWMWRGLMRKLQPGLVALAHSHVLLLDYSSRITDHDISLHHGRVCDLDHTDHWGTTSSRNPDLHRIWIKQSFMTIITRLPSSGPD